MPKSRNRSRDAKKRAKKKRENKIKLARIYQESVNMMNEAEQLRNCNQNRISDLATYPTEVVEAYKNELTKNGEN